MAMTPATQNALAQQARRAYVEGALRGLPGLVQSVERGAKTLAGQSAEPAVSMKRRDMVLDLQKAAPFWQQGMISMLRSGLTSGMVSASRPGDLPHPSTRGGGLSLVDDDTIEHEILSSRLALAMMDRASWEFSDLRSRINQLERREELDPNDAFRPHVLARIATASWRAAGLSLDAWRVLQAVLHEEFAQFVEEGFHEINAWLVQRRVMPEVDLRPYGMFVDTSGVYFHRESTHILAGWADPAEPTDYRFSYDGPAWFEEHVWPALAGRISKCARMKHRSGWSGLYEYTPDLCGIIGFAPGHDRIIEAFGFTGRGAMQSWAAGRAAAELATARRFETIDCTPLRPTRFADGALVKESLLI